MKKNKGMYIAYKKNNAWYLIKKYKWPLAGLLVTVAGGCYFYPSIQTSPKKTTPVNNPFKIEKDNKNVLSEDLLHALQDTAGRHIAIESIYTGFDYWQGKPVTRKTTVSGRMRIERPDSTNAAIRKEDPYFVNADIATIEKKWAEVAGITEIKLSGLTLHKRFTGYLSTFKKEILGIGKAPVQELPFTMTETKEAEEKKE